MWSPGDSVMCVVYPFCGVMQETSCWEHVACRRCSTPCLLPLFRRWIFKVYVVAAHFLQDETWIGLTVCAHTLVCVLSHQNRVWSQKPTDIRRAVMECVGVL